MNILKVVSADVSKLLITSLYNDLMYENLNLMTIGRINGGGIELIDMYDLRNASIVQNNLYLFASNVYVKGINDTGQFNKPGKFKHTELVELGSDYYMKVDRKLVKDKVNKIIKVTGNYFNTLFLDTNGNVYVTGENDYCGLANFYHDDCHDIETTDDCTIEEEQGMLTTFYRGIKIAENVDDISESNFIIKNGQVFLFGDNLDQTLSNLLPNEEICELTEQPENFGYITKIVSNRSFNLFLNDENEVFMIHEDLDHPMRFIGIKDVVSGDSNSMFLFTDNSISLLDKTMTFNELIKFADDSKVELAAGDHHFLILVDGDVYGFGMNNVGQLGSKSNFKEVTKIDLNFKVKAIIAGGDSSGFIY